MLKMYTRLAEPPQHNPTLALFLALYLLLLAFFIVLNALSTFEEEKSRAVIESLGSTFSRPAGDGDGGFSGRVGNVVAAGRALHDQVTAIVETAFPAAEVTAPEPGRVLLVEMRADALFRPGTAELRRPRERFVDRLVAALSSAPPYTDYRLDYLAHRGPGEEASGQTLATARAGAFARLLVDRGAEPAAVSIGLDDGDAETVRLVFRVLADEAARPTSAASAEAGI